MKEGRGKGIEGSRGIEPWGVNVTFLIELLSFFEGIWTVLLRRALEVMS
jgi:hypothetical protein